MIPYTVCTKVDHIHSCFILLYIPASLAKKFTLTLMMQLSEGSSSQGVHGTPCWKPSSSSWAFALLVPIVANKAKAANPTVLRNEIILSIKLSSSSSSSSSSSYSKVNGCSEQLFAQYAQLSSIYVIYLVSYHLLWMMDNMFTKVVLPSRRTTTYMWVVIVHNFSFINIGSRRFGSACGKSGRAIRKRKKTSQESRNSIFTLVRKWVYVLNLRMEKVSLHYLVLLFGAWTWRRSHRAGKTCDWRTTNNEKRRKHPFVPTALFLCRKYLSLPFGVCWYARYIWFLEIPT